MNKQILPLTQQAKQAITIKRLVTKLRQARTNYYNSGELLLTDNNFDDLEDKLRALAPHHSYFKTVGINFDSSGEAGKVKHLVPMLSADKAKDMTEVSKWLGKLKLASYQLIIEPKIDGLSASCRYVNGLLDVVATRGDGRTGQDITEVAGYISAIPKKLSQPLTIEVRGELYLPRNTSYDTKGKPLRNNTVGLINRKENKAEASFVHFAAYRIEGYSYGTEEEAIKLITALGFSSVPYQLVSSEEEIDNYYQQYLEQLRDQWVYETDGLMLVINNSRLQAELDRRWVVDHHHHYALAFKPPSASKVSSLINVEWQVSRSGFAIPVAIFAPIQLGGATLERASLHNAEYVGKLKLAAGDQLLIERANDVIPYVRDNLSGHGRE
ncbi:MAG: hypothetical protein FWE37_00680, partial [Spirochaetaceae bacterium]|nr:hypothetical protein [Spirochaetaceae bacterium]